MIINTIALVALICISLVVLVQAVAGQSAHHFASQHKDTPLETSNEVGSQAVAEHAKQFHLPHQHSLTLVLQRGDPERCFYLVSRQTEDRMFFEYRVRGGRPRFDLVIRQPGGGIVFQTLSGEYEETEGNKIFFITSAIGEYSMCVSGATTEIVVTLNAAVASKKRATRQRDPVLKTVTVLRASVEALLEDQNYLKSRERAHRDTLETHNTQVVIRFCIELAALLAMSLGQVFFLRRLFDKKTSRAA